MEAKYKCNDLLKSNKIQKYRSLWYKEFKYFLVYSSMQVEDWNDHTKTVIEYYGKASISSKPTFSSNHAFQYITEEQLNSDYVLSVTHILKKL